MNAKSIVTSLEMSKLLDKNGWNEGDYKVIRGFPKYLIGKDGRIFSLYTNKFLKSDKSDKRGYQRIHLSNGLGPRRKHLIHRLVATAFINNPCRFMYVNHIDNDPSNNNVQNLEWCSMKMNIQHSVAQGRHSS